MVSSAATVDAVTSRPVSEYTPAVMRRSWTSAMSTGTAYFHSNRSAMYALITSSDAMIAMIALLATVVAERRADRLRLEGLGARRTRRSQRAFDAGDLLAGLSASEIWNPLPPSSLSPVTRWTFGVLEPGLLAASSRTLVLVGSSR